jgi:hypothetical protein
VKFSFELFKTESNCLHFHISCAYDQLELLLAHALIVAHITQNHLENFYTLSGILLKLIHFLNSLLTFAFLHFLKGSSLVKGEFLSLPLFVLDDSTCQQDGEYF